MRPLHAVRRQARREPVCRPRGATPRLEQRGFVRGTWGLTESNRKARFYALTPAGKKQLAAGKREWNRVVTTMQAILDEPS